MIRLALVRHAKSDWGDAALADHDRPLNARGLRDGPRMARHLSRSGFSPQAIIASTAVRAATTAEFFSDALGVPVERQERLYAAPAVLLLQAAAERGASAQGADTVMVVAHNPGISVLANRLSGGVIAHLPTCAVATFTWDEGDWDVATAVEPANWTFDTPGDLSRP